MGRTRALRDELKLRFYPLAIEKGFSIDRRHSLLGVDFRRMTPDFVDIFDIQWAKYDRPRFVINFGKCPRSGVVHHGKTVSPEQLLAYMGSESGRLCPGTGSSTRSWFCQDRPWISRVIFGRPDRHAAEVVDSLIALFPELEAWFDNGRLGPHMRLIPYPWSRAEVGKHSEKCGSS